MRSAFFIVVCATCLALPGCKTAPATATKPANGAAAQTGAPSSAPQTAVTPANKAAATRANLAVEKLRLSELFRGTPVLFALQPDGSLRVEVPLEFSFDAGRAAVKPPLAAVLDRIAAGQRHEFTQVHVRAPLDASGKFASLGSDRSSSVRDYLLAHGLADSRVTVTSPPAGNAVRIVVSDAADDMVRRRAQ